MNRNFKNIQIQASKEFADHFQDHFNQSGANSKGEFLNNLLENWLNPDYEGAINKAKAEKELIINDLQQQVNQLTQRYKETHEHANSLEYSLNDKANYSQLKAECNFYNETLTPLFDKLQNKPLRIGKQKITINDPKELFGVMVQLFKVR